MKRNLKAMFSEFTENMWTVRNILTILRIVLIPLFIVLRLRSPTIGMCKELLMVLGGVFMLRKGVVVYSNLAGKAAQVFFIISLTLSFFQPQFQAAGTLLWGMTPDLCVLWITVGLAVYAMLNYLAGAVRQLKDQSGSAV